MNWIAMLGGMAGSGFAYSLVNGYGVLHGFGNAVILMLLGVGLVATVKVVSSAADTVGESEDIENGN